MRLNVAIVNYNDYLNTINFINSIKDYQIINNIVVVDNNSSDNSVNELNKLNIPNLKVIKNPSNSGYGEGINIAARYLINNRIGGVLLVCNTDIEIKCENDLMTMLNEYNDHNVAVVAPIIDENGTIRYGFKIATIKEELLLSLPFVYQKYLLKYRFYNEYHHYVDCIMGCMFMVRLDILEKINFFDSNMFLYYEENVLGIKLKNIGMKSVVCKDIIVKHNHSVTIDKSINRVNKYKNLKQSQRYYLKHYLKANVMQLFAFDIIVFFFVLALRIKLLFKKG